MGNRDGDALTVGRKVPGRTTGGITAFLLGILLLLSACGESGQTVIVIEGSTTAAPALTAVAERYMARKGRVRIVVRAAGTRKGIEALLSGRCDIASASSPMAAKGAVRSASGDAVRSFVFGGDLVVPIVHPDNPVKGLSTPQLRKIFGGAVTNWRAVEAFGLVPAH